MPRRMDEQIAQYVRDQNIGLVGIGAMTRMIAKAYRRPWSFGHWRSSRDGWAARDGDGG